MAKEDKRVLIADDEQEVVELLKNSLSRKGFQVAVAYDGVEAKNVILEKKPDLIILDLMMPRLDGWEVLKWLRQESKLNIPVVIISGKDEVVDAKYVYQLGADSYLVKPIEIENLLKIINLVTSKKRKKMSGQSGLGLEAEFFEKEYLSSESEKIEALINLLHQKGLVTKQEFFQEIDRLGKNSNKN